MQDGQDEGQWVAAIRVVRGKKLEVKSEERRRTYLVIPEEAGMTVCGNIGGREVSYKVFYLKGQDLQD